MDVFIEEQAEEGRHDIAHSVGRDDKPGDIALQLRRDSQRGAAGKAGAHQPLAKPDQELRQDQRAIGLGEDDDQRAQQ